MARVWEEWSVGHEVQKVKRAWKGSMRVTPAAFSSVQSLSRVWLFATSWIAARQASLSITNSRSSLKKIWNASRICVSSLRRGRANLCIVPLGPYNALAWERKWLIWICLPGSTRHMRNTDNLLCMGPSDSHSGLASPKGTLPRHPVTTAPTPPSHPPHPTPNRLQNTAVDLNEVESLLSELLWWLRW